jgi:RimJ/RimL family protein N-acetyltransferase
MVVYDGRTRTLAQMHVALEMPDAGKALLRPAFAYPFAVLGLRVLVAMVDASHEPAVAIAKRQGFTEAYRVRDGVEVGTDLILFELRRDDCRPLEAH